MTATKTPNPSENRSPLVWKGEPVATTEQLAAFYGTAQKVLRNNHARNRRRFVEATHMITLVGNDLRSFKRDTSNRGLVKVNLNSLTLWTRRGAARHAKMLNSDKAWDVFEMLEDSYFAPARPAPAPAPSPHDDLPRAEDGRVLGRTPDGHVVRLPETAEEIAARSRARFAGRAIGVACPDLGRRIAYVADNLRRAEDGARRAGMPLDTAPAWAWMAARIDALATLTPLERMGAMADIAGVPPAERRAVIRAMREEGGA